MKTSNFLVALIWLPLMLVAQGQQQVVSPQDVAQLSQWLRATKQHYESTDVDLDDASLAKITDLKKDPRLALAVIDDIIALSEVRKLIRIGSAEPVWVDTASPVAQVLEAIGKPALPKIDQELSKPDLSRWSRWVLQDARKCILGETDRELLGWDDHNLFPRKRRIPLEAIERKYDADKAAKQAAEHKDRSTVSTPMPPNGQTAAVKPASTPTAPLTSSPSSLTWWIAASALLILTSIALWKWTQCAKK